MYSFRQRGDTTVVDEPLYAHFLYVSGRPDPGREEILAAYSTDPELVVRQAILGEFDTPIVFFKQIGSHLLAVDRSFLRETENILLTRDPGAMLTSLSRVLPNATIADTGLREQVEVLDDILARGGRPLVIDAAHLLRDPARVLAETCDRLGIAFDEAMLSWPSGPKPEDGLWAHHWYQNVHRSTGFAPPEPNDASLPARFHPVLEEARPLYDRLREHVIEPPPR